MNKEKSIGEQLDIFNKLIPDFQNIDDTISDEDQAFLLLCYLSKMHACFKETSLFGRDFLSLDEV